MIVIYQSCTWHGKRRELINNTTSSSVYTVNFTQQLPVASHLYTDSSRASSARALAELGSPEGLLGAHWTTRPASQGQPLGMQPAAPRLLSIDAHQAIDDLDDLDDWPFMLFTEVPCHSYHPIVSHHPIPIQMRHDPSRLLWQAGKLPSFANEYMVVSHGFHK